MRGLTAFAHGDFAASVAALEPVRPERARICGSRAPVDLLEATLLRAYLALGRLDAVLRLLQDRRPGPAPVPVAGIGALHRGATRSSSLGLRRDPVIITREDRPDGTL